MRAQRPRVQERRKGQPWTATLRVVAVLVVICGVYFSVAANAIFASQQSASQRAGAQVYFWNEVTGEVQWDDPGDVPYEDGNGKRYWLNAHGERMTQDPKAHEYTWVEAWSNEHSLPFFYNQETKESTWERPADLAWRRVPVVRDEL